MMWWYKTRNTSEVKQAEKTCLGVVAGNEGETTTNSKSVGGRWITMWHTKNWL